MFSIDVVLFSMLKKKKAKLLDKGGALTHLQLVLVMLLALSNQSLALLFGTITRVSNLKTVELLAFRSTEYFWHMEEIF